MTPDDFFAVLERHALSGHTGVWQLSFVRYLFSNSTQPEKPKNPFQILFSS
jgi:hypothetical protein